MKQFIAILSMLLVSPVWATCILQEDTATTVAIKLVDGTDGITAETGLTVAQADIRLWKEGGTAFAQKNDATACTHRESGWYTCPLDATDTNTAGQLIIATDESVNSASVVPFELRCTVVASNYYDIFDGTTDIMTSRQAGNMLQTTVSSVTSQTVLVLTDGSSVNDAYNWTTAEIVGGTEECVKTVTDYVGSTSTITIDSACPFTVAAADDVRLHVGASGKAVQDVDSAVGSLNDVSTSEVNAEVDTALTDIGLDHLVSASVAGTDVTDDSIVAQLVSDSATADWDTFDNTTDSAEAHTDTGVNITATGADSVWDEVAEDQGSTYTARELLSILLSEAAGRCVYNSTTRIWTCKDPGNNETRLVITMGSDLDGDRDSVTLTPVTP